MINIMKQKMFSSKRCVGKNGKRESGKRDLTSAVPKRQNGGMQNVRRKSDYHHYDHHHHHHYHYRYDDDDYHYYYDDYYHYFVHTIIISETAKRETENGRNGRDNHSSFLKRPLTQAVDKHHRTSTIGQAPSDMCVYVYICIYIYIYIHT